MKNLKVSVKLIVSFVAVIILTIVVGGIGIYGMSQLNDAQSSLYDENLVAVEAMGNLRELFGNERNDFRNIFINAYLLGNESFDLNAAINKFTEYEKTANENFALYETTIDPEADESNYYTAKQTWTGAYADMKTKMFPMMRAGEWEQAYALFTSSAAGVITPITNGLAASTEQNNKWAEQADEDGTQLFSTLLWVLIGVLAFVTALSLFFALYVSRLISVPLGFMSRALEQFGQQGDLTLSEESARAAAECSKQKDELGVCARAVGGLLEHLLEVEKVLASVASGDLTVTIHTLSERDNIGLSVVGLIDNLNMMFSEINGATSQVAIGSNQIADGAQALAQGSTEQAAAVQQLSSSIAEIAEQTKENASMADQAATLANKIKDNAEKGSRQMSEMMTAVKEINDASHNISRVIKVIDDIAFQTNILALNAAVEAARAGQHGKGFAVVAEEVRNLAAKSAEAAKDTEGLIANSMEKAELGTRIADETSASLVEIVSGIGDSTRLIGDIARSSEDQSLGIAQINRGITQVTQVVQQNSATAEQSAAASQQMSGQSDMLKSLVARFRIRDSQRLPQQPSASRGHSAPQLSAPAKAGSSLGGKY